MQTINASHWLAVVQALVDRFFSIFKLGNLRRGLAKLTLVLSLEQHSDWNEFDFG